MTRTPTSSQAQETIPIMNSYEFLWFPQVFSPEPTKIDLISSFHQATHDALRAPLGAAVAVVGPFTITESLRIFKTHKLSNSHKPSTPYLSMSCKQ